MHKNTDLLTPEGEALAGQPWNVYPRPQMERESFFCLNGAWKFATVKEGKALPSASASAEEIFASRQTTDRIQVPFPPESLLSGIHQAFSVDTVICYQKSFLCPLKKENGRILLHFGAVDRNASVYLNGVCLGAHSGGYSPFSFDVTQVLREGENLLTVTVTDTQDDKSALYGKQRKRRGGMWYTPVSGIWQTVWMERVPSEYIRSLSVTATASAAEISVTGASAGEVILHLPSGDASFPLENGRARIEVEDPILWSPDQPHLYRFTVHAGEDSVRSYFALREIRIAQINGTPRILLNGQPYFFKGLLDQGYYSDGIFTPASPACFEKDIQAAKKLGFNTLRKHIKTEPALFYYACDRLGMIVFQDMVSGGSYSFLRDTALPTLGFQKRNDKRMNRNVAYRSRFLREMEETVARLAFHPCICYWTIFNEGWGQFESDAAYDRLKSLDDTRPIDTASGWFRPKKTDVESLHIYFRKPKIKKSTRPILITELGGFVWRAEGHCFSPRRSYGYGKFSSAAEFANAYHRLWTEDVEPLIEQGLCGAIYTQLSDVEDETNGLLTYDRRVCKLTDKAEP